MTSLRVVMVVAVLVRLGTGLGVASADTAVPYEIDSARGPAGLTLAVDAAPAGDTDWAQAIQLAAVDGSASPAGLSIDRITVTTDRGDLAVVDATPVALGEAPSAAHVSYRLHSRFKTPGVYKGYIVLMQGVARRIVPIQITLSGPSTKPVIPIGVHGGDSIEQTKPLFGRPDDSFSLYVQNTCASSLTIHATVLGVVQVDKPKSDPATVHRTVDIIADLATGTSRAPVASGAGTSPPDAGASGATGTSGTSGSAAAPAAPGSPDRQALVLSPAIPTELRIPIDTIDGPGIYEVETELRDTSGTYQSIAVKTVIYRKWSGWIAALLIAIGAIVSFAAKLYVDGGSDRLKLRREIALLLQQIGVARGHCKSDPVLAAARALEVDVEDRQRYVRWGGTVTELRAQVQRAELRLALLCDIIEAANQIERLEAARQAQIRKVLDDALLLVRVDSGDDSKLTAKRGEVAQLGLTATWREQLTADLAGLESQVATRMPAARAEFAVNLRDISADLTRVHSQLAADQLDAAHATLEAARSKLLESSASELTDVVAGSPPLGVDTTTWAQTATEMKPVLASARDTDQSWSARWSAFKSAQTRYATAAFSGLMTEAKKLMADNKGGTRMAEIVGKLETALKDPTAAANLYDSLRHEIEAVAKPPVAAIAAAPAAAPAPAVWQPITMAAGTAKPDAAARQVVRIDREVTWTSWMVNGVVLLVGVATGVRTLWVDDPSWGAHTAWLSALLWGASVQIAGNAFAGLATLRSKLGTLTNAIS